MRNTLLIVPVLLSLTTVAPAQTTAHERALPKAATGAWGNGNGIYDPVAHGTRINQLWFRGDNLPIPFVVREVGTRLGRQVTASAAAKFNFEVVFDNSSVTWATMNPDPTKNLGANATTLFSGTLDLKMTPPSTNPNTADTWIKATRPFVYAGPSLLVQLKWTPGALNGIRRNNGFNTNNATGTNHLSAGKSCGGTLTASQSTSGMYSLSVTSAQPNALCVFMLGVENVAVGNIAFPVDLSPAGLTGCELGIDPLILLPTVSNASGTASLSFPFTVKTSDADVWSLQGLHASTANRAGLATTGVVTSVMGKIGLVRALRVDKRGTSGPTTWNATNGPIVMVR